GHLRHTLGKEPRVRRIGHVGRHDGSVSPELVRLEDVSLRRLGQQGPVEAVYGADPAPDGDHVKEVGCGTVTPKGIRQNRCQLMESATSRHKGSNPRLKSRASSPYSF